MRNRVEKTAPGFGTVHTIATAPDWCLHFRAELDSSFPCNDNGCSQRLRMESTITYRRQILTCFGQHIQLLHPPRTQKPVWLRDSDDSRNFPQAGNGISWGLEIVALADYSSPKSSDVSVEIRTTSKLLLLALRAKRKAVAAPSHPLGLGVDPMSKRTHLGTLYIDVCLVGDEKLWKGSF